MHLQVDNRAELHTQGHILVAANMLYIGPHFRVDANSTLEDGLLDLVVYAELSKLDLLGTVIAQATGGARGCAHSARPGEAGGGRHRPAHAGDPGWVSDGSDGPLRLSVRRRALNIIAGTMNGGRAGPGAVYGAGAEPAPNTEQTPA